MALRDRQSDSAATNTRHQVARTASTATAIVPLVVAAVAVLLLVAMFYPDSDGRMGDTNNAGPSVKTVTPSPTPSTSPAVPTPNPTTEPATRGGTP